MSKHPEQTGQFYCADNINVKSIDYNKTVYDGKLEIELVIESKNSIEKPIVVFAIFNMSSICTMQNTTEGLDKEILIKKGITKIRICYDRLFLKNGIYTLNWVIASREINNQIAASVNTEKFEVKNNKTYHDTGIFRLEPVWIVEKY